MRLRVRARACLDCELNPGACDTHDLPRHVDQWNTRRRQRLAELRHAVDLEVARQEARRSGDAFVEVRT